MKIHEYQAAELFLKAGIPVISGSVTQDVQGALKIADDLGYPVVLKAQVLAGGRGKAGGIKVVQNKEELEKNFQCLRNLKIKGYPVEKILVVRAVDIKKEYYVGVTIDQIKSDVVLIASSSVGVEIEEVAKRGSNFKKLLKGRVDVVIGYDVIDDRFLQKNNMDKAFKKHKAFDFNYEFLVTNKNDPKKVQKIKDFDRGIEKIKMNGAFKKILTKWKIDELKVNPN